MRGRTGFEFQSAADGFFEDAHAFDGAISVGREFSMGKGCTQLFDEGVVASLDASQPASYSRVVIGLGFLHDRSQWSPRLMILDYQNTETS